MSVRMVTFGDICEFKYGKALSAQVRKNGDVAVFGSNGQVGTHDVPLSTGPTIIIGRKGSVGEVNYCEGPNWPIDTTYYIDQSATECHLRWLAYALKASRIRTLNKAAAVPGLNRNDAYLERVALPPLDEQKRIAAILDKADALRAKRRQAIALLDSLTQSIFLEMFGDPVSNPNGYPLLNVEELSEKYSDGPFGSNLKSEHYTEDGVRVIRLQNIGVGCFINDDAAYISPEHFQRLARHECRPGDVLIATLGDPNLRACVQPEWLELALNKADCVQLRVNPKVATAEYCAALLNVAAARGLVEALVLGQTRGRISMGRLRELRLPVAPLGMQQTFHLKMRKLEMQKQRSELSLYAIETLFTSLQHRAFSGQL